MSLTRCSMKKNNDNYITEPSQKLSTVKLFRIRIGADIVLDMEAKQDLPLPNKPRLAKVMQEYFRAGNYRQKIKDNGMRWIATKEYWEANIDLIIEMLATENSVSFGWACQADSIRGSWKFLNEKEYQVIAERKAKELNTRKETYNNFISIGTDKMGYKSLPSLVQIFNFVTGRKKPEAPIYSDGMQQSHPAMLSESEKRASK